MADVINTSPIEGTLFANNITLNGDTSSFDMSVSAVPLPAGALFLLSGVLVLGGTRRLAANA